MLHWTSDDAEERGWLYRVVDAKDGETSVLC
jgi:hypothetical protein